MIGVELVNDRETKQPLNATEFVDIWENCKDMGVLFGKGGLNGNVGISLGHAQGAYQCFCRYSA